MQFFIVDAKYFIDVEFKTFLKYKNIKKKSTYKISHENG